MEYDGREEGEEGGKGEERGEGEGPRGHRRSAIGTHWRQLSDAGSICVCVCVCVCVCACVVFE